MRIVSKIDCFSYSIWQYKDSSRLNLLEFVATKPNIICVGDFCGCNDQLSLFSKKSIVLGHTSIVSSQDYGKCFLLCDKEDASCDFFKEQSVSKIINPPNIDIPRVWISTTKLKREFSRKEVSYGLNSKVADLYFELRTENVVFLDFTMSFNSIL